MKKARFIELVCSRLSELGASDTEVRKQRIHINSYLTGLGIGDESKDLDYESPIDFADEIFKIIKARKTESTVEEKESSEDDDVKIFVSEEKKAEVPESDTMGDDESASETTETVEADDAEDALDPSEGENEAALYDELGEELESEHTDYYGEDDSEEVGATREFDIRDIAYEEEQSEEDYYDDDPEEDIPVVGNPIFFRILTVILSPVWIPLAALAAVVCAALFVLLSIFIVLYIPLLIVLILGGSAAMIAELVYSIVKFVTGQIHIGLFELGLGFVLAALVICLSVLIYRFGTKYAPRVWRNYWHGVARLFKRLKRLIRRFKGVCSI